MRDYDKISPFCLSIRQRLVLGDSAMTKLTMNTQGGYAPQQQAFAPPPQPRSGLSGWVIAGGAFVFLALFTGLIITSTLLFVQSNQPATTAAATGLTEPTLQPASDAVTRTNVDLLRTDQAAPAQPAAPTQVVAAAVPAPVAQPAPAPVQVASTNTVPLRLGRFHRYRVPTCVDYLDTLVGITTVNFPVGGDEPNPADMIRVRNIATAVEMCDEVKVIVEGHSDRRGSEKNRKRE